MLLSNRELVGALAELGDGDAVAEHVEHPAQLGRLGRDGKARLQQLLVEAVARPQHHAVLAEGHRLPVAVGRDVADAEDGHDRRVGATPASLPHSASVAMRTSAMPHWPDGQPPSGLGAGERPAADGAGADRAGDLAAVDGGGEFQRQRHGVRDRGLEADGVAGLLPIQDRRRVALGGQRAGQRAAALQGQRRLALADRCAHHQVPGAVRRHVRRPPLSGRPCLAEKQGLCQGAQVVGRALDHGQVPEAGGATSLRRQRCAAIRPSAPAPRLCRPCRRA